MKSGRISRGELPTLLIELTGHLSVASLKHTLAPSENLSRPHAVVFDASAMSSYDAEARQAFIDWNRRHLEDIGRVAVVTQKLLWRSLVATMAMMSGQRLRAFAGREEALEWAKHG